jgi:signal transduction histidine kinase
LRALSREREREAERRAEQERMRIARELHDILAHTIAVINVQAGFAADVLADDPEQARASLRAIRDESRDAIGEVKAALGVLRAEENGAAPRPPAPRLSDLDRLVAAVNDTDLAVEVSISGEPRPLPPAVELTAYRIAQEALTNVVRHANAGTASIALSYESDGLTVDVSDDGQARSGQSGADQPGYGIVGMRERVRALGGTLEAGPVPGEGFRVLARLPAPSPAR